MKNKKGFTLIELLAVIVILAIIIVISIPIVTDTIEEAKKGAFSNSVHGVVKSIELEHSKQILNGKDFEEMFFSYENGEEIYATDGYTLDFKGKKT